MTDLLDRVIAAEDRADAADAEAARLRKLVHKLLGDGDESLGLSAAHLMGRATAAEGLVREVLQMATSARARGQDMRLEPGWESCARARMAAAMTANTELAQDIASYTSVGPAQVEICAPGVLTSGITWSSWSSND